MKTLIFMVLVMALPLMACSQQRGDTVISSNPQKLKLKLLYFHITDRCHACYTIEDKVRETVFEHFMAELEEGILDLHILNCELEENQNLVAKYDAYGATLAFSAYVNGVEQKPDDITNWAFQRTLKPELFISELKEKIEKRIR
jgi:hypothetical protein